MAIAGALAIVIIAAGVYVYLNTLPPSVRLLMKDPPPYAYISSVSSLIVTFSAIQIAQMRSSGFSWITLNSTTKLKVDLVSAINTTKDFGSFLIPAGNYTGMRFNVATAVAIIATASVNLTVSSTLIGYVVNFASQLVLSTAQRATITIDVTTNWSLLLAPPVGAYALDATMTASFAKP